MPYRLMLAFSRVSRQREECVLVGAVGEARQRLHGIIGKTGGSGAAVGQGVGRLQQGDDFADGVAVARFDDIAQALFFCGGQLLLRADEWQRRFALGEVVAERFADERFVTGVIEQVVHDLKGHAQFAPVHGELFALFCRKLGE